MTHELTLNLVQEAFMKLAQSNGIATDELLHGWSVERGTSEWKIDYRSPLQEEVAQDLDWLLQCFDLHRKAMETGDRVTAKSALVLAAGAARTLESTFRNIHDECYKVLHHDARFTWPDIPEDYKIPESYDYKGPR